MAVASEFDYLTEMIPHHDEAIATARILERNTERQEMRSFAASIIDTQSAEVRQMKEWLVAWYPDRDTRVSYQPMMRDLNRCVQANVRMRAAGSPRPESERAATA